MKVVLIRPSMTPGRAHDALEPLPLAILAGLTPPDIDRVMYDDRIESVPFDTPADLVAMSVDTFSARRAYQMAQAFHAQGVRVVMGGPHPTLCPDEVAGFADVVVRGDADDTWPQVLSDARKGTLQRVYTSSFPPIAACQPDRGLYAGRRYGTVRLVQSVEVGVGENEVVVVAGVEDSLGFQHRPVHRHRGQIRDQRNQRSAHGDALNPGEQCPVTVADHGSDESADQIPDPLG